MRVTNVFPNDLNEFPVDNHSGINRAHKKTNESVTAKPTRLYLKPKQEENLMINVYKTKPPLTDHLFKRKLRGILIAAAILKAKKIQTEGWDQSSQWGNS